MHPVLVSRARLGTYLLGWIPGVVLLAGQFMAAGWKTGEAMVLAVPACLLASALFLSSWYLCRVAPLRQGGPLRLLGTWAAAAAIMGVLWSGAVELLRTLLLDLSLLRGAPAAPAFTSPALLALAGTGAVFYGVTVAFHYLLIAQGRALEAEHTERDLRELAREAELKALRAQLNPHFLFNSLNSISALTSLDPRGARRMCVLLAEFLRKSLSLGERSMVSLAEELDLVRAYLAIEQIRFGARLQVEWEVDPDTEGAGLPPLLLQPLVENAIKHGIAQLPEGGTIRIAAAFADRGIVEIRVANPRDPEAEAPAGLGLGLRQMRRRLGGCHGPAARVEAGPTGTSFEVVLSFPVEEVPHA